jgi:polyisoprenoid-binding protein YceI
MLKNSFAKFSLFSLILTILVCLTFFQNQAQASSQDKAKPATESETKKPDTSESTYIIDNAHSLIGFSVRHLTISEVHGRFNDFTGTIHYNEKDVTKSSVEFTSKAASINTDIKSRDEHLRGTDFFDVEKYPELTFKSTRIESHGQQYLMVGQFTMHGVTKEISFPFQLTNQIKDQRGKTRFGVQAQLTINRQDYGISWSKTLDNGGLAVSNEVKIELNFEAIKQ